MGSLLLTEPVTQRPTTKRRSDEPGILTAEGTNKVVNTTTTTVVEQDEQPNLLDMLNDPGFIESHRIQPLVDDVYDLVPSRNDPQAEVTQEPQGSGDFPTIITEPQSPFSPGEGMRSDGKDVMVGGMEETISNMESMGIGK